MNDDLFNVKISKDGMLILISVPTVFMILFIFTIYRLMGDGGTSGGRLFSIGTAILFLVVGWGLPLLLYLRAPHSFSLSESELILKNRMGKIKRMSRMEINKLTYSKCATSKDYVYIIHYNIKSTENLIPFDEDSGKAVYDWYHNEGEWAKDETS